MFSYFAVLGCVMVTLASCMNAKHDHEVSGTAKIRLVLEQEICVEKNGFKTDEQKRECVMSFVDCTKGDADGDNADED